MAFSTSAFVLLLVSSAHLTTCVSVLESRDGCDKNYATCSPKGASTQAEPPIGSALSTFYVDIVNTVDVSKNQRREIHENGEVLKARASGGSLCCTDGTQCLLLQGLNIPFCYDNYTTNYFLPGGSYGQIVSGNYTSTDGSVANLISGNYTIKGGTSGNIYGSPSPSKPDTATLHIPTQYTASGSGSAIPVTALGQEITYTTTIPGTTVPPSILPATTTSAIISAGSTIGTVTTTEAASTIQGTTVVPQVSTVTTRLAETAGTSATKKGSAMDLKPSHSVFVVAALLGLIVQVFGHQ